MVDLKKKYAQIILKTCLKVKQNQPLFISANKEVSGFVRIVANEAYEIGIKEIYFDITDVDLKHDALKNLNIEELKKMQFWNKCKWNEYAKKDAAFLMLASENPGLMNDISVDKINKLTTYALQTRQYFDDLRNESKLAWCIVAVPTPSWAKEVFPKSQDPINELWQKIFEICLINESDPEKVWQEKIEKLKKRCQKLTAYQFKRLVYQNKLGTNLQIALPKNHLWASGKEVLKDKREVLVNFPTEEVFTSPTCNSAEGIVYSSRPLAYQDNIIDNFYLKFEKGKVVDFGAEKGEEYLKELLTSCDGIEKLGEVALVEYSSPISKSNIIFYETLYDENASCHLALGDSFAECIENGIAMSKEELKACNLNSCLNHVDFMIGTKDLTITGINKDNKEIKIFENGDFTKEFK